MNVNRTLSAILNDAWLIDPSWVNGFMPRILSFIEGNQPELQANIILKRDEASVRRSGGGELEGPFAILNGKRVDLNWRYDWDQGRIVWLWDELPKGSVAVIPVNGPIMKYNGSCGELGTQARLAFVDAAASTENVSGIIMLYDTPGGQVSGTSDFAKSIAAIDANIKPVLSLIDDCCCSAGMWSGAGAREMYAIQDLATIGSIGVFTTLINPKGAYEKLGYQVLEIYAPESSEKNEEWREAIKGNPKLMEARLSRIAQDFRSWISERRGDRLVSNAWEKGKTFNTQEAIDMGLIDGQLSLEGAAERVLELASTKATSATGATGKGAPTNNSSMKFALLAQEAAAGTVSDAAIQAANAELTEAGLIASVTLIRSSITYDAAVLTNQNTELSAKITSLTEQLATANTAKETAEASVTTLNGTVAELQGKLAAAPAAASPVAAAADKAVDEEEDTSSYSHNQLADQYFNI